MQITKGRQIRNCLVLILCLLLATWIGWTFKANAFPETNIVIIYLLAVFLAARLTTHIFYGIGMSVAATLTFNYFFTEPYYTLKVNDYSYMWTFLVMTIVSVLTSMLTYRVKKNAEEAIQRANENQALYNLTNHLTDAKSIEEIAGISVTSVSDIFACHAAICCMEEGEISHSYLQYTTKGIIHRELDQVENFQYLRHLQKECQVGKEFYEYPIFGQTGMLAVLRIPIAENTEQMESQRKLLMSMLECTALAMDRFYASKRQQKLQEETRQEHYRSNLLRGISHDLRTPLSGIMGTSEMIQDMSKIDDPRYSLAQSIWKEADWLHNLVENILNLTRLEDGRLLVQKEYELVEELVAEAISIMEKRAPDYEVEVEMPEEMIFIPVDAKLIIQVLVNLMENAAKHSKATKKKIDLSIKKEADEVIFSVRDYGKGIKEEDLGRVFQAFYTTGSKSADANRSMGLGLAICEAIIHAHGGRIYGENERSGGAKFVFTIFQKDL